MQIPASNEEFAARLQETILQSTVSKANTINAGLNFQLQTCDLNERSITVALELRPWMNNPYDTTIHGGVSAALADHVLGVLLFCYGRAAATPTVNLQLSYVKPVKLDKRLMMKAKITGIGHRLGSAYAEAWMEGETDLVFTATGTFYMRWDHSNDSAAQ